MNFDRQFKNVIRIGLFNICLLGLFASHIQANCGGMFPPDITKEIVVDSIHSLAISGNANVFIKQEETASLSIKAPKEVLEDLDIKVKSAILSIKPDNCDREYTVYVTMKEVESLKFSGSVTAESTSEIQTGDLQMDISGSANI
ncbi:DUF2807 domain-containing protein [bacterium]|nr:DUF2807 domain-containing protein [bacterium]